ncbi:hypothetical protein PVIIG_05352 [Plasmodium vivax India VII]|uniref:VIR protein n=1 Tax=Plasmodium vivax India VII TaxID=1077284 RepID=A0A0J9SIQ2_PLAVI|nr:hypothetical protein PVIIG_05352 [Plasmodium vivax India VII]
MGSYSTIYFNKIYDIFKTKNNRHSVYHSLLHEIITYTSIDAVFADADPRIACKFINYLLNDKLRKSYYHNDRIPPYEIYKNFVKDFYEERHGGYHKNKACDIYIEDIKEDIFKKMAILYQLYDEYDGLKKPTEKVDTTDCIELSKFAKNFNYAASNHGTNDSDLLEKLTDLRNLIENRISSPNYTCGTKINYFHLPQTSSTVQEKQDQAPSQEKRQQGTVAVLQEMSNVPNEPEVSEVATSSSGPESVTTQMESHTPAQSVYLEPLGYGRETRNYESRTSHESVPSYLSASSNNQGSFHGVGRPLVQGPGELYTVMDEENGNIEGGIHLQGYRRSNAAVKEEGASGILSSISGVLGGVDPVPVVGVSGGMGALFLLFRVLKILNE